MLKIANLCGSIGKGTVLLVCCLLMTASATPVVAQVGQVESEKVPAFTATFVYEQYRRCMAMRLQARSKNIEFPAKMIEEFGSEPEGWRALAQAVVEDCRGERKLLMEMFDQSLIEYREGKWIAVDPVRTNLLPAVNQELDKMDQELSANLENFRLKTLEASDATNQ
jgi:hypothetical protein